MMTSLLTAVLISATPHTLVLMPFQGAQIDPQLISFSSEHLAQSLNSNGFEVLTPQTVSTMLGLERQKQMLGCSDAATSCLAELSGALGADAVISGTMAKLGKAFHLDVRILNPADGKTLALGRAQASSEEKLIEALDAAAASLVLQLRPEAAPVAPKSGPGIAFWAPVIGGAVAAGTGAVLLGIAVDNVNALQKPGGDELLTLEAARNQLRSAELLRGIGIGLISAGALSIAAGALFGRNSEPPSTVQVTLVPTSGGAMVGVQGALP